MNPIADIIAEYESKKRSEPISVSLPKTFTEPEVEDEVLDGDACDICRNQTASIGTHALHRGEWIDESLCATCYGSRHRRVVNEGI